MKRICSTLMPPLIVFFLLFSSTGHAAPEHANRDITISLPAETVLQSLRNILPFTFSAPADAMEGAITVRSIDTLEIENDIVTVHGILEGKDIAVATKVANQNIRMKLGKVILPLFCDLRTRYNAAERLLYLTPSFPSGKKGKLRPSSASLRPLLAALAGKEYPVKMDRLQLTNIKIGDQIVPITMEPVDISGTDNTLVLKLRPTK